MNPADAKAIDDLKQKLAGKDGNALQLNHPAIPWLVRVVEELHDRVRELEAGPIDEVIAKYDAQLAERDAEMAKLAAQVAQFERDHLPEPSKYYRSLDRDRENASRAFSSRQDVASGDLAPQTDEK